MNAEDIKDALRKRHPAEDKGVIGPWTCLEEYREIDLLAISAWSSHRIRRVGYEVKISRSDYRRELLNPRKRARAVAWCEEFYLAVPASLLTAAELAWAEPEWEHGDFQRTPCEHRSGWHGEPGLCYRGKRHVKMIGPLQERQRWRPTIEIECDGCGGKGYAEKSRVEREAPMLWVPRDVGLVVVDADGKTRQLRKPLTKTEPSPPPGWMEIARMVRHASSKPDRRHLIRALENERART